MTTLKASPTKEYGFITPDDNGPDVFVHYGAIMQEGYRELEPNQRVSFDIGQGEKGHRLSTSRSCSWGMGRAGL